MVSSDAPVAPGPPPQEVTAGPGLQVRTVLEPTAGPPQRQVSAGGGGRGPQREAPWRRWRSTGARSFGRELADDDPEAAEYYATLVSLLNDRYERTADPALLDEAVTASRVGLALLPSGAPTRWAHLTNLAVSLKRTAEAGPGRAPDLDLLREAVDLQRQAVVASLPCPVSSSVRAGLLANLTSSLAALHDRTGDPAPFAEAIRVGRRAVAEIRQDDGSRSRVEANLAAALSTHGMGTGDREAVAEALGLLETAACVPLHVLRKIAGHGSLTTTQRYLHPDAGQITAAGAALSAHLMVLRAPRSLPVTAVTAI